MENTDIMPQSGDKTEALTGGPYNGVSVKQTIEPYVYMTVDHDWFAVYGRNKQSMLEYLVSVSPELLKSINPKNISGGIG